MNTLKDPRTDLGTLLDRDALAEAERFTGQSYKEDSLTANIGLVNHIWLVEDRKRALEAAGDTAYSMRHNDYTRVLSDVLGFTRVLEEPFKGRENTEELFQIWWHPDGLLLKTDTFTWEHKQERDRNSATVYYNWRPNADFDYQKHWRILSSYHWTDDIIVGNHDACEGLVYRLSELRKYGDFLPKWRERPWLWLLHHQDDSGSYQEINRRRISLLPQEIQDAIGSDLI